MNAYIVGKFDTEVYYMPTVINIYTLKINSISSNASVNIGETFHSSHSANLKSTGSNTSYGDEAPPISTMKNIYVDPDVNDQNQMKTPARDTPQQ